MAFRCMNNMSATILANPSPNHTQKADLADAKLDSAALEKRAEPDVESVLVVARTVLDEVAPRTFSREADRITSKIVANCRFMARHLAEQDFAFKQIIPYVVIRHGDRYLLIR